MDTTTNAATADRAIYRVTFKRSGVVELLTLSDLAKLQPARPVLRLVTDADVAAEAPATSLRFVWNAIKVDGKAERARYTFTADRWTRDGRVSDPHVTVWHNSHCGRFSAPVHAAFQVENRTDSQSDCFDADHFDVRPSHPLFSAVAAAAIRQCEHDAKHGEKMAAKGGRCAKSYGENAAGYRKDITALQALLASVAK